MKVKIFTEAGENIGYGHLSRCYALYQEIKAKDHDVEIFVAGKRIATHIFPELKMETAQWYDKQVLEVVSRSLCK